METKGKSVLIISYYFPPNPIVGSRRWAKYGKVLQKLGIDVFVLAAESQSGTQSSWDDDIKGLKVKYISASYPAILDHWGKKSVVEKIKYRVADKMVKIKVTGMPYDRSVFWEKEMITNASQIIEKHNIKNVIVSTPPHRASYYTYKLKQKYSDINFMVDFRDPWTWGSFREYPHLNDKDRKVEEEMAKLVVDNANTVIVPVEKMEKAVAEKYPEIKEKIYLLSSAFDKDDFNDVNVKYPKDKSDKIKFIYFGSLYDNLNDHITEIASAFSKNKDKVELHIYSKFETYKEIFEKYGLTDIVFYHKPLPSNKIFQKVTESNFVFLFKPYEYGKDNVSTKYFEIIYSKTPVFLIGDNGMASEFIVSNQLGFHANVNQAEKKLNQLINNEIQLDYNLDFNVDNLSFQFLGAKFNKEILI
ncbi:hypothetical protein K6119_17765 [Paracrocinitomix mangrovi]|uniref:hypothetical protein n=1 Tax=Paracrocinitomix mangrovi TaxID=2862509 RepID=UPI001C8D8F45|nr:hypothetical protein [Paracrocinitomix mangrovi]UKN01574.1 hypothetical protein K6119_17765 [Paracrocinitomix mangrovi]